MAAIACYGDVQPVRSDGRRPNRGTGRRGLLAYRPPATPPAREDVPARIPGGGMYFAVTSDDEDVEQIGLACHQADRACQHRHRVVDRPPATPAPAALVPVP